MMRRLISRKHGPGGRCGVWGCYEHLGAPSMPEGYSVWWHEETRRYSAHGPNGWKSAVTVDPYQAGQWALEHAGEHDG